MFWLASYPGSGSNFFKIILHEFYGLESATFRAAPDTIPGYLNKSIVKTHHLPRDLVPGERSMPSVYIVRDGRDSTVSFAHLLSDIVSPGSRYENNLAEVIISKRKGYFGGWSGHVAEWLERADIVIRFEELITNPIECAERLRSITDFPKPRTDKVPTFEDLRRKDFKPVEEWFAEDPDTRKKTTFFRRGIVGSWKDEMPENIQSLFWELHGDMMEKMGYVDGRPAPLKTLDKAAIYLKTYGTKAKRFSRRLVQNGG